MKCFCLRQPYWRKNKSRKFSNYPKPNFSLYVISFICTNFEAFTTFRAVFTRIRCTRRRKLLLTVNRTSAISVKRELLPVLWVQLKSCLFNVFMPPSLDYRKRKQELIIFIHTYLLIQRFGIDQSDKRKLSELGYPTSLGFL